MFDFRRITLFCLGYHLSKHKITVHAKNFGRGIAPWLRLCNPDVIRTDLVHCILAKALVKIFHPLKTGVIETDARTTH